MASLVKCPHPSYEDNGTSEKQIAGTSDNTFSTRISSIRHTYPSLAYACSCQSWCQTQKSNSDAVSELAWHTSGMFVVVKSAPGLLRNMASRLPLVHLVAAAVQMFAFVPPQSEKSWNIFWFPCGQSCVSTAGTNHWRRICLAPAAKERRSAAYSASHAFVSSLNEELKRTSEPRWIPCITWDLLTRASAIAAPLHCCWAARLSSSVPHRG